MIRLKYISAILFMVMAFYSLLTLKGSPLADPKRDSCMNKKFNSFLPWDSGCFYSAFFEKQPSIQQINYEHQKLNTFHERGGLVQHILWYRSVFYQKFADHFKPSYDSLDEMHMRFTESNPTRTISQINYIQFLELNGEHDRAQKVLDHYCQTYVPTYMPEVVKSIVSMLMEAEIKISVDVCYEKIGA